MGPRRGARHAGCRGAPPTGTMHPRGGRDAEARLRGGVRGDCSPSLVTTTHSATNLVPTPWGEQVKAYLLAHAQ